MLDRCALRADPVCCFVELAVNFFVQSFMLSSCAIAFNDFSGTNIGMAFRSVITDTDSYIVVERQIAVARVVVSAYRTTEAISSVQLSTDIRDLFQPARGLSFKSRS